MKIILSKSQWESVGKKAGWLKVANDKNDLTHYFDREADVHCCKEP